MAELDAQFTFYPKGNKGEFAGNSVSILRLTDGTLLVQEARTSIAEAMRKPVRLKDEVKTVFDGAKKIDGRTYVDTPAYIQYDSEGFPI